MSMVICFWSVAEVLQILFFVHRLYKGINWPVRAFPIICKAIQMSVNYVCFLCSFENQIVFLSSLFESAEVAGLSVQRRSVVLSCSRETEEISASGWCCHSKDVCLLSCCLLSSRAKAQSLCTMSLQIDQLVLLWTRSFWLICINCINKDVRVFSGSQISLCLAMSKFI